MSKKHVRPRHIEGPFVPLLITTLDSPAWRALSHGAKALYVAIKRRYDVRRHNNGKLYLPLRQAEVELRSKRGQISRWFRELQHYGFIVQTSPGGLGVHGHGRAPHWRLTEMGVRDGALDPPTREFIRWDGTVFTDRRPLAKKQKPGPKTGTTSVPKTGPLMVPKPGPSNEPSGPENGSMSSDPGGPEKGSITRSSHLSGHPGPGAQPSPPVSTQPSRYVMSASARGTVVGSPTTVSKPIGLDRFLLSTVEVP